MPSIFSFKSECSSRDSRSVRRAKSKQDACKSDITQQATRVSEVSADSEQCEGDQVNASEMGNGIRQEVGGVLEVAVNGQAEDDRLVSEDLTVDEDTRNGVDRQEVGGVEDGQTEDDRLVSEVDEDTRNGVDRQEVGGVEDGQTEDDRLVSEVNEDTRNGVDRQEVGGVEDGQTEDDRLVSEVNDDTRNGVDRQEVGGVEDGQTEDDRLVSEVDEDTRNEVDRQEVGGVQNSDEDDSLVSEDVDEEMMDGVHREIESETSTLEQSREEFVISMEIELEKNEVEIGSLQIENEVLVEENESFREENSTLKDETLKLKDENLQLKNSLQRGMNHGISSQLKCYETLSARPIDPHLHKDNDMVCFYTGLPTYDVYYGVFKLLQPIVSTDLIKSGFSLLDQYLLTLMKLRLSLEHQDLAYRFGISLLCQSNFSKVGSCYELGIAMSYCMA